MSHNELISYLMKEKIEHIIIVKKGITTEDIIGNETQVSVDNSKLYLLEGSVLYHNHVKSSTFSFSDVKNMLLFKSKKMFLVTKNYLYSIVTPKGVNWQVEIDKLEQMIKDLNVLANEEIERLVIKENMDIDEASLEKSHYIWLYISNIYEFEYKRKRI